MKDVFARLAADFFSTIVFLALYLITGNVLLATGVAIAGALALAEAFWPGPLTLVLPKTADCAVADLATAGLDTVAIRIPAHPVAREILRLFGRPVVAPSANLSGHVSPTTAAHVHSDLSGRIDLIVEETVTCYEGDCAHRHDWGYGCGVCPACDLRARGYAKYRAA